MRDKLGANPPETRGRPIIVDNADGSLPAGIALDLTIGAGVGALIGGRAAYLLLDGRDLETLTRFTDGGVGWHGVLIGGLLGLWVAWTLRARRQTAYGDLLDSIAPLLAGIALTLWVGCAGGACGWGHEVTTLADYPAWAVAWAPNAYGIAAPRYDTPLYGALLASVIGVVTVITRGRGRFWLGVMVAGAGMFLIGFWRADPVRGAFGLRVDQVADALIAAWGIALYAMRRASRRRRDALRTVRAASGSALFSALAGRELP
ncbi:MAG: prolipoprotein diacylglyceryl transferase [Chloroflexota bacterium]|nr:prolipoprotein diacylglyceryl transferase [Chloroflexota bacterium]